MERKTAAELSLTGSKRATKAVLAERKAEAAATCFEAGEPPRPRGLAKAQRRAWNALVAELTGRRVLSRSDGALLMELLDARSRIKQGVDTEDARSRVSRIMSVFDGRTPFAAPAPAQASETDARALPLADFIAGVRQERSTFATRMQPDATVCLDASGAPYSWSEGDAAAVARSYCQQVTHGAIVAGDLLKRACQRHLDDLEAAHERGYYFDPLAARNIATWLEVFCGLTLIPWQVWILTTLFGWKKPSGARRFDNAWVSVAKKQGKSLLAAAVGLFGLVADGEKNAEIYSVACKKDQSKIIWEDAMRMSQQHPELKEHIRKYAAALVVEDSFSTFKPLSSDTSSMDGLRPQMILCDELHEWENRALWAKLVKGTVSRTQPLVFAITTAGENRESFCYTKHEVATRILTGVFDSAETFVAIYELDKEDDYRVENNWPKANPSLGITVQVSSMRKALAETEQDPSALNEFLRYNCNTWVAHRAGRSIPADKWDLCRGWPAMSDANAKELQEAFLELNKGRTCFAGFDLGLLDDMTAFVMLWPKAFVPGEEKPIEKVVAIPMFWMPEHGLQEKERQWNVPLSSWAREGWITLVPGDMVDVRTVAADILALCQVISIREIGYDRWNAQVMMGELAEKRACTITAVPQHAGELTTPCKEFKSKVWSGDFWHLNNPVLRWQAQNLVLDESEKTGGVLPTKLSKKEKIDGMQAMLTAWNRMLPSVGKPDPNDPNRFAVKFI